MDRRGHRVADRPRPPSRALRALERIGALRGPAADVCRSHAHMTLNRLGVTVQDECRIAALLAERPGVAGALLAAASAPRG